MPWKPQDSSGAQSPQIGPQSHANKDVSRQLGAKPVSHDYSADHVLQGLSLNVSGAQRSLRANIVGEMLEDLNSKAESRGMDLTTPSFQRLQNPSGVEEPGSEGRNRPQGVPAELQNLKSELAFVGICSVSLMIYSFLLGDVTVNQAKFKKALAISNSELPWLVGSYTLANGLALVVSGSIMDLAPPKPLMVGAFAWLTAWHVIGFFTITPSQTVLFFIVRAMQGLAIGFLVSGSMSLMGRIYKPGLRKNRVFSAMAATSPFGYWLGALQGGGTDDLRWIFGSNAAITAVWLHHGLCCYTFTSSSRRRSGC
ncbi:hypothetical protein N7451_012366 [Penicillium sp. IBT 35674x]|nr:hypothetical protein N7451_012366 [Penicillium sp. IBT 35674x]